MNLAESGQQDNATVEPQVVDQDLARIFMFAWFLRYICLALGIPGNIASAIVWLRLHKKNSSAVYLAAIAINDLVYLLSQSFYRHIKRYLRYPYWLGMSHWYIRNSCVTIEPLLTLGFSVERLLAICWPLKVLVSRGVDPYGTGGTRPPQYLDRGGHDHECPPPPIFLE